MDNIVVGRLMGAEALGTYSRSFALLILPLTQVQIGLGTYGLRLFSQYQANRVQLREQFLKLLAIVEIVAFPFAAIFVIAARPIVLVMFGPQWLDAVPLVRSFAIAGAVQAAMSPVSWLILALGRTPALLRLGVVNILPLTAVVVGAIAHDFAVLAVGYGLIGGVLVGAVAIHTAVSTGIVRSGDILGPMSRHASAGLFSAALGAGVLWLSNALAPPYTLILVMGVILFSYATLMRVLDPSAFRLMVALISKASYAVRTVRQD
jgi:PST family polysaccharide transporter